MPQQGTHSLDVLTAAFGSRHGALLAAGGALYTWGVADGGRLGQPEGADAVEPSRVELGTAPSSGADSSAEGGLCSIACGEETTYIVGADGIVLLCGRSRALPTATEGATIAWVPRSLASDLFSGLRIASLAAGPRHVCAVSLGGASLFSWGEGAFGALGHGDLLPQPQPRLLHALHGRRVLAVACGVWHTAALLQSEQQDSAAGGELWAWGDGDRGQRGDGKRGCLPLPQRAERGDAEGEGFTQVACGATFTLLLGSTSGTVFATGREGGRASEVPRRVPGGGLDGTPVGLIAAGEAHCAVLTADRHSVLTWGAGAGGRLGHGDERDVALPQRIAALVGRQVRSLTCGPACTAVVCVHVQPSVAERAALSRESKWEARSSAVGTGFDTNLKPKRTTVDRHPAPLDSVTGAIVAVSAVGDGYKEGSAAVGSTANAPGSSIDWLHRMWMRKLKVQGKSSSAERRPASSRLSQAGGAALPIVETAGGQPRSAVLPPPQLGLRRRGAALMAAMSEGEEEEDPVHSGRVRRLEAQVRDLREKQRAAESEAMRCREAAAEAAARAEEAHQRLAGSATGEVDLLRARVRQLEAALLASMRAGGGGGDVGSVDGRTGVVATESAAPWQSRPRDADTASHALSRVPEDEPVVGVSSQPTSTRAGPSAEGAVSDVRDSVTEVAPGVYITVSALPDGTRELKRVRFSRRKFSDTAAQSWWEAHRGDVVRDHGLVIRSRAGA